MKKIARIAFAVICTIVEVLFIWKTFKIDGNTILYFIVGGMIFYFINEMIKKSEFRKFMSAVVLATIFSIIEVIIKPIDGACEILVFYPEMALQFAGYFIGILFFIVFIFDLFSNGFNKIICKKRYSAKARLIENRRFMFFIDLLVIILAWLPYLLRYFPGLLTADSCTQMSQAIGLTGFSNHHPIFHTLIITIFVKIGNVIFNNLNLSVAVYIVAQMIMMASSFAFVMRYLYKKKVNFIVRLFALAYYMFYPINALFAITMWKDVLFAGILPLFVIYCNELVCNSDMYVKSIKKNILFVIIAILTCLLRNNGIYIVLLTCLVLFVILRKYWKRLLIIFSLIFIIYFAIKMVIFNIFQVKDGSIAEMMSVPLQQIARVEKYHKGELDKETIDEINKFFKVENIGNKYNPRLSDPVKAEMNVDYFNSHKKEFISLWFRLLKQYFKTYVESFILNSYGYYYPEAKHWVANRTMEVNNMGIEQSPIIEGTFVTRIDSLIERREIPLSSMCFSIGMAVWLVITCCIYKVYDKDRKSIAMYIPIFILWLTIIASPVYCEYRYAYPIFTTLPIYLCLNFKSTMEGE